MSTANLARKEEELKGIWRLLDKEGLEVRYKTPMDGNCFFHAVGEQLGTEHKNVRRAAVRFLRENSNINGEEWSGFTDEGKRGKRSYKNIVIKVTKIIKKI